MNLDYSRSKRVFLSTLTEVRGKIQWQVHAYCLMSNEFRPVEREWYLDGEEFRQELLTAAAQRIGAANCEIEIYCVTTR